MLTHYALRALMSRVADDDGIDPDRISFTRALRAARRSVRAGLGAAARTLTVPLPAALIEIGHEFLPQPRLRAAARVVKRKMSSHGVNGRSTVPGHAPPSSRLTRSECSDQP